MSGICLERRLSRGIDAWGNLHEIVGVTYDAAGNLTNHGQGHTYSYDAENRLTAIPGYSYVYHSDGKRVNRPVQTATRRLS